MALIKNQNFSRGRLVNFNPQDGDVIESCNLSQMYPHTAIAEGVSNLSYSKCNLTNCDVVGIIDSCNTTQISRCGNLDDEYDCVEDCEHVVGIPEPIIFDGVTVETLREYKDKVVS